MLNTNSRIGRKNQSCDRDGSVLGTTRMAVAPLVALVAGGTWTVCARKAHSASGWWVCSKSACSANDSSVVRCAREDTVA